MGGVAGYSRRMTIKGEILQNPDTTVALSRNTTPRGEDNRTRNPWMVQAV